MLLTPEEMAAAESALFATGAEAEPLMDRAGEGIAAAASQFYPLPGDAVAFVGDGHNGGDALVALRHLRGAGWRTGVRFANSAATLRPLTAKKLIELSGGHPAEIGELPRPTPGRPLLLIDGLLGIGARGELRPAYREAAEMMNEARAAGGATVAVDIPSGLDGQTGRPHPGAVVADLTCTIAHPKPCLLADGATEQVGRLALVPLPEIAPVPGSGDAGAVLLTAGRLAASLPRRRRATHKGESGRVGIIAGSRGMAGAATLCATGALRGGGGLVKVFAAEADGSYPVIAAAAPPEAMVSELGAPAALRGLDFDAIAVGPGLGARADAELVAFVLGDPRPLVIDADALNALAASPAGPSALREAAGPRLLTPHPGEMARLEAACGLDAEAPRRTRAEALAAATGAVVLLKGSPTVIASPAGEPTAFSPTGGPAMATGGVGDTLTGLIAALAGGGRTLLEAAQLGAWINGRAAERALRDGGQCEESLLASDLPKHYGGAFEDLRAGAY